MTSKKCLYLIFLLFFVYSFSFASGLMAPEAINHYNDGLKAQKAANSESANSFYDKALLIDANNRQLQKNILNNRGLMYAAKGDYNNAELLFNEALKIDPEYKAAKMNLGLVYEKQRSRLESLEYWAKIYELDKLIPKDYIYGDELKNKE